MRRRRRRLRRWPRLVVDAERAARAGAANAAVELEGEAPPTPGPLLLLAPRCGQVPAAGASTLSGTSLAMFFEFGNDLGLPRCVRLEIRTMMCTFLGKQVVVAIAVDR